MGYEVHITRKAQSWADEGDSAAISLAEWQEYVAGDAEMRMDNQAEAPVGDAGEYVSVEAEGLSVWLAYSKNGRAGNYAWFSHQQDRVTVKNPDEEILNKMLAVARAMHARVQGDDDEYYEEVAPLFASRPEGDVPAWASSEFRAFQTFASAAAADPLLAALSRQGIDYRTSVDNGQLAFDPSFANNQLISRFIVKLQLADFERAGQVLADLNQYALSQVDRTHYLFSFSDEELFEALMKPDEWSAFDVTLASQLLRQRGRDISPDTLRLLRQHRVAELARPDQDHRAWVAAGYLTALLGGLLGIMIGYQLYFHRKQLPDGRRVYAYSARDRVHGARILVLGAGCLLLWLAVRLSDLHLW